MKELPEAIRDFVHSLTEDMLSPAYMLVDDDNLLKEWGGDLVYYGIAGLQEGTDVSEAVPLLLGLLPLSTSGLFLPYVQTGENSFADVYLFRREEGSWVLFLDVSRDAAKRRQLQQRANEIGLKVTELKREEEALSKANLILEERVQERTAELVEINLQLRQELEERKKIEAALRASESRFRRLYESNLLGIMFWDMKGNIIEANDLYLEMIGYTQDDLKAGSVLWNHEDSAEGEAMAAKAFAELRETGACQPFKREFIRKDGSRINLLFGAALVKGTPEDRVVCFALDPAKYR